MKYIIFANHEPTGLYVEADSKKAACRKLGITIKRIPADEDLEPYYLKAGNHEVYIAFDEIYEISSNVEIVTVVFDMMDDSNQ